MEWIGFFSGAANVQEETVNLLSRIMASNCTCFISLRCGAHYPGRNHGRCFYRAGIVLCLTLLPGAMMRKYPYLSVVNTKRAGIAVAFVGAGLLIAGLRSVVANSRALSGSWPEVASMKGSGGQALLYSWIRKDDSRVLHTAEIFVVLDGNTMALYRSQMKDPFGGFSRCGGFPCSLEPGTLLGKLVFEASGSDWRIVQATDKSVFLAGAVCSLSRLDGRGSLSCHRGNGPLDPNGKPIAVDSIFRLEDLST
jgi:hypothetical protein